MEIEIILGIYEVLVVHINGGNRPMTMIIGNPSIKYLYMPAHTLL